jgi:hypothetical protein
MFDSWRISDKNAYWRRVPFELGYWRKRHAEAKTDEERGKAAMEIADWEAAARYWDSVKRKISVPPLRDEPGPLRT